jgi:hypothetical protein
LDGDVIRMIVPAVRFEGEDYMRLDIGNDPANRGFDVEHVDVRECVWVIVPLTLFPRRIVKTKQHRRLQSEPLARQLQLLDPKRAKVFNRTNRRMRPSGLTVGGTDQRHAYAAFAEVSEDAAMKDLVIGMGQDDQE